MATKTRQSAATEPAPKQTAGKTTQQVAEGPRRATLRLPFLTARFEVPRHMNPGRIVRSVNPAGLAHKVSSGVPSGPVRVGPMTVQSPGKAVYYVGLGALAAVEVVEWPIAAAIA